MKKKRSVTSKQETALAPTPDGLTAAGNPVGPAGYDELLGELKARIRAAQIRAAISVNRELVLLYWQLGRDILARQQQQGWGAKVIDRLSTDLRKAFPEMKGFSPRNLKYMRAFAEAWPDEQFVQQVVAQIPWGITSAYWITLKTLPSASGTSARPLSTVGAATFWSCRSKAD